MVFSLCRVGIYNSNKHCHRILIGTKGKLYRCFRQITYSSGGKIAYEVIPYTGETLPGEKKDTSCPLPKAYSPSYTEAAWYDWWVKEGFFTPEYQRKHGVSAEKFVICLPPPNVTGTLHLGHALTNSVQDALVRWNRMRGVETLWIPGCDHAGIATQVVVEKRLANEKGLTRHQLGREKFVEEAWKWKKEKGDTIYEQMKRLGSSLDWSRAYFTMDEKMSEAVIEAFVSLYEDGLIYRSNRMINWSCQLQSVISDIEVENVQIFRPTQFRVPGYEEMIELGKMTSFAYPVVDSDETVTVATTRPETMLGDTAVAVHPEDPRYSHLHGRVLRHPFENRLLPIVCDDSVQKEFGTGAVKITPAHDYTDFNLGQRHGLESISVIDKAGCMENVEGKFLGMKRFHAREAIIESLKGLGLYKETVPHKMLVPLCSRSGDVIEPMLMEQWFVDCELMGAQALEAVKLKDVELIPDHAEYTWNNLLCNTMDWCISRQIWWGHRIPMYRAWTQNQEEAVWVVGRNEEDARRRAEEELGQPGNMIKIKQDSDVLDTWFSSALIPFSSLGWPKTTEDYTRYFPNTLLETGSDILFCWVARMVMMGIKLTDRIPFKTVALHGMLRDANGRKMSKSLGNVIDPVDTIVGISLEDLQEKLEQSNLDPREIETALEGQSEDFPHGIPECGTDALRFTLCSYNYKEQSINMNVLHAERNRKFCNKIWQSFGFVSSNLDSDFKPSGNVNSSDIINQWILGSLCRTIETCNKHFKSFDLHRVCISLYEFWLLDFCGVYLEYCKPVLRNGGEESKTVQQVLYTCTDTFLRAMSPFMPYLCEELYQRLPHHGYTDYPSVCVAPYPQSSQLPSLNPDIGATVNVAKSVVATFLNPVSAYQLKSRQVPVYILCRNKDQSQILNHESVKDMIHILCRCKSVDIVTTEADIPKSCIKMEVSKDTDVHIFVKGLFDSEVQIIRIQKKLEKTEKKLKQLKKKKDDLSPSYIAMIRDTEDYKRELEEQIQTLKSLKS